MLHRQLKVMNMKSEGRLIALAERGLTACSLIRAASGCAVIGLLLAGTSGCKVAPPQRKIENTVHPREDVSATQQQVRLRMRALVEPLSGAIVEAADRIIAGTTNRTVQREALLWKIQAVPTLREALFRPNPFVADMDAWVLIWQMSDYFESGRGHEALGSAAPIAVQTCQQLANEIETVSASLVKSGNVTDAADYSRRWAKEHPIRYSIASRESTLSRVTERELKEVYSTQEVAGTMLVTLDDLARRMDTYSAQLFDQARWQAELVALDLADKYDVDKAMPLAETAVRSTTEAVAVLKRLEPAVNDSLAVAKSTPETIARERTATMQAAHEEVSRIFEFVRAERTAALDVVAKEREAALVELHRMIAVERKNLTDDAHRIALESVDHAMLRAAYLTAIALISVFVGAVLLLLTTRRIFWGPPEDSK
jgi:hypothetical protein